MTYSDSQRAVDMPYTCIHTYIHVHTYVRTYVRTRARAHTYIHTYKHTLYIHTGTCIDLYVYNYIFQTTEAGNTSADTQAGRPTEEPEIVESTSQPPNKASKRKPTNDDANDSLLKKACSIMVKDDDEFDVFGNFVASELRCLKQDVNRRRLKRIIQRAILDVAEDDEAMPTP